MGRNKTIKLTNEESRLGPCTITYNNSTLSIVDDFGTVVFQRDLKNREDGRMTANAIIEWLGVSATPKVNVNMNVKAAKLFKSKYVELVSLDDSGIVTLKSTRKRGGDMVYRVYAETAGRTAGRKLSSKIGVLLEDNTRYAVSKTGKNIELVPVGGISFGDLNMRFNTPVLTSHVA